MEYKIKLNFERLVKKKKGKNDFYWLESKKCHKIVDISTKTYLWQVKGKEQINFFI